VWKCNSHSQKWENGVLRDSWKLRARFEGSNLLAFECSWFCWKGLEVQMSKMASHEPFGHLQPKLWAKEGPGVKLAVWFPTIKSQESTSSQCWFLSATWRWKALKERYNFGSDLVLIGLYSRELWAPKVPGLQPWTISRLQLGSPGKKCHLDVASAESCREYYMGEGGGFPESGPWWVLCQSARGLSQHPRVFPNAN